MDRFDVVRYKDGISGVKASFVAGAMSAGGVDLRNAGV
jgi:hypothetical protein